MPQTSQIIIQELEDSKLEITTPRLLLRAARPTDAASLHEGFSDIEVMRYWSTPPHASLQDTTKWIDGMIASSANGVTDFLIVLRSQPDDTSQSLTHPDSAPVIGKVGMWQGNEIGFLLCRKYWGQKLAIEAVSAILDLVFAVDVSDGSKNKIPEDVMADVDPRNTASLKLLQKLGFEVYETKERTLRVGEEWVNSVYLRIKRDMWLRQRST